MLEVRNLDKRFGGLHVTRGVSFRLERGERRVVLGPNGAGKSTLFNLLAGELRPSAGTILLDGVDITRKSVVERARMGLSRSYQRNNLFESLTIRQNLSLAAAAGRGDTRSALRDSLSDRATQALVEAVATQVELADRLDLPVHAASYGNRRQLEVGIALATRPSVLLMDEPTSGIGPNLIGSFTAMINDLPRDLTMIIVEHDLDLAFDVADSITVLNYGEVVFDGAPGEARESAVVRDIYLGDVRSDA